MCKCVLTGFLEVRVLLLTCGYDARDFTSTRSSNLYPSFIAERRGLSVELYFSLTSMLKEKLPFCLVLYDCTFTLVSFSNCFVTTLQRIFSQQIFHQTLAAIDKKHNNTDFFRQFSPLFHHRNYLILRLHWFWLIF